MKILVIGGMHGNEPLGLSIARRFLDEPVANIDVLLANQQAIEKRTRFVEVDLNRSFPGDAKSASYEVKRAAEIVELCKQYDLVLDFHNTHCPDNDCGFVGQTAEESLYGVAWQLGLKRIIIADYDCLNKYAPNCLSVEVSLSSELNRAGLWYEMIKSVGSLSNFEASSRLERFRFVYRITLEDKQALGLEKRDLKAFEAIDAQLAEQFGLKSPVYPIFIGDAYTPYNYGGLLKKLNSSN